MLMGRLMLLLLLVALLWVPLLLLLLLKLRPMLEDSLLRKNRSNQWHLGSSHLLLHVWNSLRNR